LEAELRVKHGVVNLNGTALIGEPNQGGGSPAIKETIDGAYVTDGYGGTGGANNVYSDNGTSQDYDLGDELHFPSVNDSYTDPLTGTTYNNYSDWLQSNALVINGDIDLQPGVTYGGGSNGYGSISMDANGNLSISGIVYVSGNVTFTDGKGKYSGTPVIYDGRGTIVSGGSMYLNTHILSKDRFPTNDVMGFLSMHDLYIGTGAGAAQLDMMAAFFAQNIIQNAKQNQLAGAMVSNYFDVENVPHMYFIPAIVDNLPPGMPGSGTINKYTYRQLAGTWREL